MQQAGLCPRRRHWYRRPPDFLIKKSISCAGQWHSSTLLGTMLGTSMCATRASRVMNEASEARKSRARQTEEEMGASGSS